MDEKLIQIEGEYWKKYVHGRIPTAYPGIREIMMRQKAEGGKLAVISHSYRENIIRDYQANDLPMPDCIFGWEMPPEKRKPYSWPLNEVLLQLSIKPDEALVIDDLKPGFDMAQSCGVPFAAAGWANDIPQIEKYMRSNCSLYFKRVRDLASYLFEV